MTNQTSVFEDQERLRDLQFFADLTKSETDRILKTLAPVLVGTETNPLRPVVDLLAGQLGSISARMALIEQAAELHLLQNDPFEFGALLHGQLDYSIDQIFDSTFFHSIEIDDQQRRFAWTKVPQLTLPLRIYRDQPKILQIYFTAIIKREYTKTLKIQADGQQLSYRIFQTEGHLCIECTLPVAHELASTQITMQLPDTHSPAELGLSDDLRPLGLAVHRVKFGGSSAAGRLRRFIPF